MIDIWNIVVTLSHYSQKHQTKTLTMMNRTLSPPRRLSALRPRANSSCSDITKTPEQDEKKKAGTLSNLKEKFQKRPSLKKRRGSSKPRRHTVAKLESDQDEILAMFGDLDDSSSRSSGSHKSKCTLPTMPSSPVRSPVRIKNIFQRDEPMRTLQGLDDDIAFRDPNGKKGSPTADEPDVYESLAKRSMVKIFGLNGLEIVQNNELV